MDEADKYKQRLEVIAEKRRLQEEQDKARREMEEQKLRLQQLKRKSLRDQWLMEGGPSSPTSPDALSPHSPLWGPQVQEIEKYIDKLQSQSQQLAVDKKKLKDQMEDGQMISSGSNSTTQTSNLLNHSARNSSPLLTQQEAVEEEEAGSEKIQAVVQNRENSTAALETTEDDMKNNQSQQVDETVTGVTNGGGNLEADANPNALEQRSPSTTNGPVGASEGVINVKVEAGLSVSEAESYEAPNISILGEEEEEEEGTLVIRAERVTVTDEDDDLPEDPKTQDDEENDVQSEESPLRNPEEGGQEGEDAVEEVVKTVAALEPFPQPESDETRDPTAEAEPASADGDMQDGMKTSRDKGGETKGEGQDKQSEDSTSVQMQTPSPVIDRATPSPVPVYSQSALSPELEAASVDAMSPEGAAAAALEVEEPAVPPDQFQEVPLADPQENQRKEAGPEEQEPLLSEVKAADTPAEPAAGDVSANVIAASQGGETEAAKPKTCQCCSVM